MKWIFITSAASGLDTASLAGPSRESPRERGVHLLGLISAVTENPKLQSFKEDAKMHFSFSSNTDGPGQYLGYTIPGFLCLDFPMYCLQHTVFRFGPTRLL